MEVQVAQLQARVTQLTTHMKAHKKDHSARRGLLIVLGQRNKYLKYMYAPPYIIYYYHHHYYHHHHIIMVIMVEAMD